MQRGGRGNFCKRDAVCHVRLEFADGGVYGCPGNPDQYCFAYLNMNSEAETGVSGWSRGCCFVTGLRPDLWSNLGVLYRWLSQRKR